MADQSGRDGSGAVLVDGGGDERVCAAFSNYQPLDGYVAEYLFVANAEGLDVRSSIRCGLGGDDLSGFLDRLADDFRRWNGEKTWRSLEGQLQVGATWNSGGHVLMEFRVLPRFDRKWSASVEVAVEAGEQMSSLAAQFQAFFVS